MRFSLCAAINSICSALKVSSHRPRCARSGQSTTRARGTVRFPARGCHSSSWRRVCAPYHTPGSSRAATIRRSSSTGTIAYACSRFGRPRRRFASSVSSNPAQSPLSSSRPTRISKSPLSSSPNRVRSWAAACFSTSPAPIRVRTRTPPSGRAICHSMTICLGRGIRRLTQSCSSCSPTGDSSAAAALQVKSASAKPQMLHSRFRRIVVNSLPQ